MPWTPPNGLYFHNLTFLAAAHCAAMLTRNRHASLPTKHAMMLVETAASPHPLQLPLVLDSCLSCHVTCPVCTHSIHSASDGPEQGAL